DTDEFYRRYVEVHGLVRSLDDLAGLCRAMALSGAGHGVVYLEPGIEPQLYAPRLRTLDGGARPMPSRVRDGASAAGIEGGCMIGVNADHPVEIAEEVAAVAARHAGEGVVGFGTSGFIEPAGLSRFRSAVGVARAAGLVVVSHAGQIGGPE